MADNELNVRITANADGVKAGVDQAKEHLDLAAESVSLLGDLIGVKVPEAIQKALAGTELLGPALNAAFIPLQIIAFLQELDELQSKVMEAVHGQSRGWRELSQTVFEFHEDAQIKLLQLAQRLDELKGQHLAGVQDKLKEIDAQSLKDLGAQFDQIAKKADSLFASMEVGWFKAALLGQSGAQEGIKNVHQEFDLLMDDIKSMEKAGNFSGIGTALDGEIARVNDLINKTFKAWETTAQGKEILAANIQRLQVLQDLKAAYEDIAKLSSSQKDEANQAFAPLQAASRDQAARAFMKGLEDQLTAEKQTHLVSIEEELHFWQAKLAAAAQYPDVYREIMKKIGDIDQAIGKQRAAYAKQVEKQQEDSANRVAAEAIAADKKANDAIIKDGKEKLDAQAVYYQGQIDAAKVAEQITAQNAARDLAQGKITKQQEIAVVAAAKQQELQLEIQYLRAKEQLYDGDEKKVAQIEAQITKLIQQQSLIRAKAEADSAKATAATYKQLWSSIGNDFKSMLNGLIQGNETLAQAFAKLYTQLLEQAANYFEQMLMKKLEDYIMSALFAKKDAATSIAASGAKALAAGVASVMAALPFPANVAAAPGVGASAAAMATGPSTALLESMEFEVGAWNIPFKMPAILHPGEMVVPSFQAGLMRSGGSGGGGSPLQIHFNVSALDGADAVSVLKKNMTGITNLLLKQLKKKGFPMG